MQRVAGEEKRMKELECWGESAGKRSIQKVWRGKGKEKQTNFTQRWLINAQKEARLEMEKNTKQQNLHGFMHVQEHECISATCNIWAENHTELKAFTGHSWNEYCLRK